MENVQTQQQQQPRTQTQQTQQEQPDKKMGFNIWHQLKAWPGVFLRDMRLTFWENKTNLVMCCMLPIMICGLVAHNVGWDANSTFSLNFVGIVPLAGLLCFATEELAEELGETIGGLLNASFGNAVELIIAIIALKKNEIAVVQYSMLGSIISNTLLVLGCTFLGGSCNNKLQSINAQGALALSSLLLIVAVAFSLPTIHFLKFGSGDGSPDSIDKDHVKCG
ncbi:unnamed protein product [Ambrosiozyma monospora]|uniref:Unnamed protein product n=1 Tax=Ambrosiozyma monospora TaxID=43982 RepID=A0A9W6YWG7_AMBMO|nr:unnamed protein product [Ambrosiozyma monospora]